MSIKTLSLNGIKTLFAKHKNKLDANYSRITHGITIIVSTDGDDTTGDGSNERPFASLQSAVDALGICSDNCSIYIKPGEYSFPDNTNLCIPNGISRLTISSYNRSNHPVISFSGKIQSAINCYSHQV